MVANVIHCFERVVKMVWNFPVYNLHPTATLHANAMMKATRIGTLQHQRVTHVRTIQHVYIYEF